MKINMNGLIEIKSIKIIINIKYIKDIFGNKIKLNMN